MKTEDYLKTSDLARLLGVTRQAAQQLIEKLKMDGVPVVNIGQSLAVAKKDLPKELDERIRKAKEDAATQALGSTKDGKYLGYEKELWSAADKLRGSVDPSEYKHIVLGLLFLKYISDSYSQRREELEGELSGAKISDEARQVILEDKDQYRGKGVFYVPAKARWGYLKEHATQGGLAGIIDDAMTLLETDNPNLLAGVLFKDYTRANLDEQTLEELINIFSKINFDHQGQDAVKDTLGQVYEYFLGQFAASEGRRGGEFYTPRSLVRLLVEVLSPYENARVFDPACGSGGMFVQSSAFLHDHHKDSMRLSIFGQESNQTTLRLCKMNLAVRGIFGDIQIGNSYYDDKFPNLKADFVLANPPFNSEWNPDRLPEGDPRIKYGKPPGSNANFMWIQHFIQHLAPGGMAGFVMANGALAVSGREGEIRKKIVQDDLVEVIIACPPKLFYNVSLPVSLWFVANNKKADRFKDRSGKVLFIDARETFHAISKKQIEFTPENIKKISDTVRAWRGEEGAGEYQDIAGFCKSATLEEIEKANYVLTPGRYVGIEDEVDDGVLFADKVGKLTKELEEYFEQSAALEKKIKEHLKGIKL
jgi:type I restriction enzyme M protein